MIPRRYEIVRFKHRGHNEVLKTVTCTEEEVREMVEEYESVRGHSFVGYRAKDRTEAEVAADVERTQKTMRAIERVEPHFTGGRRRYLS